MNDPTTAAAIDRYRGGGLTAQALGAYGLLHKRVLLPYGRRRLRLWLSQSLFSGDDVDTGTRALLGAIDSRLRDLPVRTALDLGCGSGVIGVALATLWPAARIVMSDRDALAVAVSALNAAANGACGAVAIGCLGVPAEHAPYDLVAANLPAKVGEPVLRMLVQAAAAAAPRGHLALVVIRARQELVAGALAGRARVLHRRELRAHTLFLAEAASPPPVDDGAARYLRGSAELRFGGIAVPLQTAWGLPDFDAVPHLLRAAEPFIRREALGSRVLTWNPGQGLAACALAAGAGAPELEGIAVGSRDLLQVVTTRRNLAHAGCRAACVHAPLLGAAGCPSGGPAGRPYSGVIALHGEADGPWWRWLPQAADELLAPGGRLLVAAASTPVERALRGLKGFAKRGDRRRHGCRAVLLERPS